MQVMWTDERYGQSGGDPYERLRNINPDFTREIEAVMCMELCVPPHASEAAELAAITVDAVFSDWQRERIARVDAMPAEWAVVRGVFEFIHRYSMIASMDYPYPARVRYSLPSASRHTVYTYERAVFMSDNPKYSYYDHQTVTRSITIPLHKPRRGRVDVLLARPTSRTVWYPTPSIEQVRFAGQEIRDERVYIEAHGTQPIRVDLN